MKLFTIAALMVALAATGTMAETYRARVTRVIDGDTIEVDHNGKRERVRLQAIDAPERGRPGAAASTANLRRMLEGKSVTIESQKRPDKYGRTVGKFTANGTDAGLAQIQSGQARHFKKYEKAQPKADRRTYAAADRGRPRK